MPRRASSSRARRLAPWTLVAAVLCAPAAPGQAADKYETNAQRLHRKGVFCMEEIERSDCAIEKFEELLEERTEERELITDALLRLVKLYDKAGRVEDVKQMLRVFWEAGKGRAKYGHLLYSTRYLPEDLDAFASVQIKQVLAAPLTKRLPPDLSEYPFSCDDERKAQIRDIWLVRRAKRHAKLKGTTLNAALQELAKKDEEREQRYKSRQAQSRKESGQPNESPVFAEHMCDVVRALGQDGSHSWVRASFALSHKDGRRSVSMVEIPGLDALLASAAQSGSITPVGEQLWKLPSVRFHGQDVQLARLDLDELTIAPANVMRDLLENRGRKRRAMNKSLRSLLSTIPDDSGFFAAATEETVRDMAMTGFKKGTRRFLELFMPRPKGIQIAGVAHEYLGFFVRMPTDTPVKGELLVSIARRLVANAEDEDDADMLKMLDISSASDGRALLFSYVISQTQIREMMLR
ncbi:MAG: hypothetical protein KC636_32605 [Myxococcales bacterium]|nr:hypothetical protein [Myxococcales bacterium]